MHKNIIEWLNSSLVHIYAAIHINKVDFNIEKNDIHIEKNDIHIEKNDIHIEKNDIHIEKNDTHMTRLMRTHRRHTGYKQDLAVTKCQKKQQQCIVLNVR